MHIQRFDVVTYSLKRTIPLLADSEEEESRRREDQEQVVGFRRKLEQEKQLEEMRMEMRKQFKKKEEKKKVDPKGKPPKLVIPNLSVQHWIGSGPGTKSRLRLINSIT